MDVQGGPAEHPLPGLNWRPMTAADLDGVVEVARACFPNHPEDRACFENRLALYPEGCRVLADAKGRIGGYRVAYPWRGDGAPALNTLVHDLPHLPDRLYLHDLAIAPAARGGGRATQAVTELIETARTTGWSMLALVAVNDAAGFWARHGFVRHEPPGMAAKLAGYGPGAAYMVRPLSP